MCPPPKSATCGSQSTTSGASPGASSGRTYGGLETTRSQSDPGRPESMSCRRKSTAIPVLVAFSRASESASSETSMPVTRAPGCSSAIASAIAPEPVPTSRTRGASTPRMRARQRSTTVSVSGRGISARPSTISVRRRKPHSPTMYWSGSRAALRAASSATRSCSDGVRTRPRSTTRSARESPRTCADEQLGVEPGGEDALGLELDGRPADDLAHRRRGGAHRTLRPVRPRSRAPGGAPRPAARP